MRKLTLSLVVFTAIIFAGNINAQTARTDNWCYTDENNAMLEAQNPTLIQQREDLEEYIQEYIDLHKNDPQNTETVNFIIPVVFHVITNNGDGFVSKADIDDAILTLNEDFQRLNSDASSTRSQFAPYAADFQVEFRLAHKDPNGACTEGIVRVESPLSVDAGNAVKGVSIWDPQKYFNVWTVVNIGLSISQGIVAGYAQFPSSGINNTYGVVMDHRFVNRSDRTLSHEVGHCFNLFHTFQSGCSSSGTGGGDRVTDTPPSNTNGFGCGSSTNVINTCSQVPTGDPYGFDEVDQTENFMSYASCQNMFSAGQKIRAEATLNSTNVATGLRQLSVQSNLDFTGTSDTPIPYGPVICTPVADFEYDKTFICEGASVTYSDNSHNGTPTAWNWTFVGGSPSTSTASSPTVTYNSPGIYSTTYQPATSAGAGTITKTDIVTVSSLTADYSGILIDGFESNTDFDNDWIKLDPSGGQDFERTTSAFASGSASAWIANAATTTAGLIDELISPSYNLSTITNPVFKFKVASARKTSASNDRLLVYYSVDCGENWTLKLPLTANNLATTSTLQPGFWVPTSNDWVEHTININDIATETNVRFKFEFQSGIGNNLFLDDINIDGTSSINDQFDNIGSLNVYPNPTNNGSATISFNLTKNVANLQVSLMDIIGKEIVSVINEQSFPQGKYTLNIDQTHQLKSGIYFIQFRADDNVKIEKLIVQ